jgi:hypothetical protein
MDSPDTRPTARSTAQTTSVWEIVGSHVRGESASAIWGRLAIVAYVLLSAASVAWGLSGGTTPSNELGAAVELDVSSGYPAVVIDNRSGDDWTDLRVILDQRYYHDVGAVLDGRTVALSLGDFADSWVIPRPRFLFTYERAGADIEPLTGELPSGYLPRQITLRTSQGTMSQRLDQ